MRGLSLFSKTSSPRTFNLASWHSPHSMTWSWILSISRSSEETNVLWPIFMPYRTNGGLQFVLRIPFIALVHWHRQRPMWYRDLYNRKRDEQDGLLPRQKAAFVAPTVHSDSATLH